MGYWLTRFFGRRTPGPSHCRNCDNMSFTAVYLDGVEAYRRWKCDHCGKVSAGTFGGKWRIDDPKRYENRELTTEPTDG